MFLQYEINLSKERFIFFRNFSVKNIFSMLYLSPMAKTSFHYTTLTQLKTTTALRDRLVLVRINADVPIVNGRVASHGKFRLEQNAATLLWLVKKKARVMVIGHRGRPKGKRVATLSLEPLLPTLRRLVPKTLITWYKPIWYRNGHITPGAQKFIHTIAPGTIGVLENIRFIPEEEKNDRVFAKELSGMCDLFVQDSFSVCHRKSVSITGVPRYVQSVVGISLERQLAALHRYLKRPRRPYIAVVGGVKISTKLGVIHDLLRTTDYVLLGGALANTVLQAQGVAVGRSLIEPKMIRKLRSLALTNPKIKVPLDVVVAKKNSDFHEVRICAVGAVAKDEMILDIGPETIALYARILGIAKTVVWNGPMGLFEDRRFAKGTYALGRVVSRLTATTIVGGGDTVHAIAAQRKLHKMTVVSTGGGALLSWLEGGTLPGIEALEKWSQKYGVGSMALTNSTRPRKSTN